MLTQEQIDELFSWIHRHYPNFEEKPGPPSTREIWHKCLESFQPQNVRRGAMVFRELGYPPITPLTFSIACRGGKEFLLRHLEGTWRRTHGDQRGEAGNAARGESGRQDSRGRDGHLPA